MSDEPEIVQPEPVQERPKRRLIGRQFVKGQSGNPAGRPKAAHNIKKLARQRTLEAFERIVELMRSDDERVAMAACKEVLDRGWGRAPVSTDEESVQARTVVVNIVRYGGDNASASVASAPVSDGAVALPRVWGPAGGSRLS